MMNEYYDRLEQIESGGDPNAKNPKSSASGPYQFTKGTAKQYGLDDPTDPVKARQAVEKFTADNAKILTKKLGREPTQGELYLAHQQGAGGALKLLSNPDKNAIEVLGVDQVMNNGGNEKMTAKEFAAKWTGKFGDKPAISSQPVTKVAVNQPVVTTSETKTVVSDERINSAFISEQEVPTEAVVTGPTIILPDGNTLQLTGQETPEVLAKIKAKIFDKYGNNLEVDRKSGAPVNVRAVVGSISKPEDRLATIQKYYPDAMPYGEDNFVYTDPQTNKRTLYNPKGLDLKDVASVGRELAVTAGSMFGAAGGAVVGLGGGPVAPASVPAGAIVGSGFGAMAGGSAFDLLLNIFSPRVDTRTAGEENIDRTVDFAGGAIGEGVGRALSVVGKKLLGGGATTAQKIYNQFKQAGIRPSASVVSQNASIGRLEAGLTQIGGSADVMEAQAKEIVQQTQDAVAKVIANIGDAKTPQGAGETIKKAAVNAAARFDFNQEKFYDEAFDLIGLDSTVKVDALKELALELRGEISRAPNTLGKTLGPALNDLNNIIADAGDDGINFTALRQIRTAVGRDLAQPMLTGSTGAQNAAKKRIYGALTDDMSRAAASTSDEAAKKLAKADRFTRIWMNTARDTMEKINKFDADEKAFKFALTSSKDGGTSLARLRRNFTNEEWDTVAASVLNQLGDATAGTQNAAGDAFSINTFVTNWNKLAPEAKTALFGGARYKAERQALDSLVDLMAKLKDVNRFANTSNTSGSMVILLALNSLGAVGGAVATGDVQGAAGGLGTTFAGTVLAPRLAAKLLTNPAFIQWLGSPLTQAGKKGVTMSVADYITRLIIVGEANPEIKEEINQFIKQMQFDTANEPLPKTD